MQCMGYFFRFVIYYNQKCYVTYFNIFKFLCLTVKDYYPSLWRDVLFWILLPKSPTVNFMNSPLLPPSNDPANKVFCFGYIVGSEFKITRVASEAFIISFLHFFFVFVELDLYRWLHFWLTWQWIKVFASIIRHFSWNLVAQIYTSMSWLKDCTD